MRNALKTAAGIPGVCLLYVIITGPPAGAQQPSTTQPQTSTQQQSTAPPATVQPPAPPPSAPAPPAVISTGPFYGGDGISLLLQYGLGVGHPVMGTGHANGSGEPSSLDYMGTPRPEMGATFSIPVGKHNAIRASYFRMQGNGNPTVSQNEIIYGVNYYTGNYLAVHYVMQNIKLSLDYLSWPFPVKDSKFHVKTLWELQYTNIGTGTDAPLLHGETDASGAPVNINGYGSDWFIYPSFGLGADYLISQKLRFEARASGFAFPHRSTIWDTEATLNYRLGKYEIEAGLKDFHFKTNPEKVEFVRATFPSVYVGFRWYPEYGRH